MPMLCCTNQSVCQSTESLCLLHAQQPADLGKSVHCAKCLGMFQYSSLKYTTLTKRRCLQLQCKESYQNLLCNSSTCLDAAMAGKWLSKHPVLRPATPQQLQEASSILSMRAE